MTSRLVRASVALALAASALGLATAPARAQPAAGSINVCVWGTITGPDALLNGQTFGVRDYFDYLNQTQGGIAGQKVNVLMLDGRYKLDEELKIYRRCVEQEQAVLINGWSTGAAKALRPQVTADQVPYIADSVAADVVDPAKLPYNFIVGPTYEQQILVALRDTAAKGGKTVVLMHADNEYGRAPVGNIQESGAIGKLGLTLAETVEFRFDAQDMTAQLLRVKARSPDLIYLQGSPQNVLVALRDAAKIGLPANLFVANFLNLVSAIPEQLGAAAEGFRAVQSYEPFGADIPASKQIAAHAERNKLEKRDGFYMKGWLKGQIIAAAIGAAVRKQGGKVPTDIAQFRKAVRDELEALKGLDVGGITPPMDFADHQGSVRARLAQVRDGRFVAVSGWLDAR